MLTAKKFAEELGRPYSTVALWLKDARIPEAERHELEGDKIFYLIPASAVAKYKRAENQPTRGRPPIALGRDGKPRPIVAGTASSRGAAPRRRTRDATKKLVDGNDQSDVSAAPREAPAEKPTKARAAKKTGSKKSAKK